MPRSGFGSALGASRWDYQHERGFEFWVMRDPWDNEFCVLNTELPQLLAQREPWPNGQAEPISDPKNGD